MILLKATRLRKQSLMLGILVLLVCLLAGIRASAQCPVAIEVENGRIECVIGGGGGRADPKSVTVELRNAQGKSVGKVVITANKGGGVSIKMSLKNLPPGEHSFYFHQHARCGAPVLISAWDAAYWGNINNNFSVNANGKAEETVTYPNVNMGLGMAWITASGVHQSPPADSIFSNGGTALVIYERAMDGKSDPSVYAHNGIACGDVRIPR